MSDQMRFEQHALFQHGYLTGLATTNRTIDAGDQVILNQCAESIKSNAAKIKGLDELLKVARCPNAMCDGTGSIAQPIEGRRGEWEQQQCQWCDERKQVLE